LKCEEPSPETRWEVLSNSKKNPSTGTGGSFKLKINLKLGPKVLFEKCQHC
jgi:hypothetical protein